jgi:putative methionine-R-sulfoxide reductase with GAF domain
MDIHRELLVEFNRVASPGSPVDHAMQHICDRLHAVQLRYNWVGFYLVDEADPSSLILGPHAGVFTPFLRISLNQGLCGAAASLGKTVVVNDVSKDPRYLMGAEAAKSEMVVPIVLRGVVVAVLDINSFFKDTWNPEETAFVEQCAALVKRCM